MTVFTKRNFLRRKTRVPVLVLPPRSDGRFLKEADDFHGIRAKMVNQCKGGLCFEAEDAFPTGTNVTIRIARAAGTDPVEEPYEVYRGRVKWCRAAGQAPGYGMGVEIFETVIQADVKTTRLVSNYDA